MPQSDPILGAVIARKRLELELMMFGIPKSEINDMSPSELIIVLEILKHMGEERARRNQRRD